MVGAIICLGFGLPALLLIETQWVFFLWPLRILATGASPAEVLEAFTWVTADDQLGTELQHGRHGAVGAVYEILLQEEPDAEELQR